MELDILTLAIVSCLVYLIQVIALFVQYRVNESYTGVKWWLAGTVFAAIGVIFMPLVAVKSLVVLAMLANPLVLMGQIFILIGTFRFLDKKEPKWLLISIFVLSTIFYYYFMFVHNNISSRTHTFTASMTVLLFMTAYSLFRYKDKVISGSAIFSAVIFLAYGCFTIFRFIWLLWIPTVTSYLGEEWGLTLSFIVPIGTSLLYTFGFIIMLNQRLNSENREEKEKLQRIFNTSPDAAIISRVDDGLIVDVNAGFSGMTDFSRSELIGHTTIEKNIWNKMSDRDAFLDELRHEGFCENREFLFRRKNGSQLIGSISSKIISIKLIPHIISVVHDITYRKQAEEALRESEELYRSILDASPDVIAITDLNGFIQIVSPAAKKMFGFKLDNGSFIGTQMLDYLIPEDRKKAKENIVTMLKGKLAGPNEYHAVNKELGVFNIEVNSGIIHDANEQPSKLVFVIRNITERKQNEMQIQQLVQQLEIEKTAALVNANTDCLTALANRRYFDEMLAIEFLRLKRSESPLSLIMLDVDRFKSFNDYYGHLAGDNCLRQIGLTLRANVSRATDIVARYGGEEFVVVLSDTDRSGAVIIAERIRMAVELLAIPHSDSDVLKYVTVSLGVVTLYPSRLDSMDEIVSLADKAMYFAKNEGRNRVFCCG